MEITIYVDEAGNITIDYPNWMSEQEAVERAYAMLRNR